MGRTPFFSLFFLFHFVLLFYPTRPFQSERQRSASQKRKQMRSERRFRRSFKTPPTEYLRSCPVEHQQPFKNPEGGRAEEAIYVISLQGVAGAHPANKCRFDRFRDDWSAACGATTALKFKICPGVLDKRQGFGLTRSFIGCFDQAIADGVAVAHIFEDDARLFANRLRNSSSSSSSDEVEPKTTPMAPPPSLAPEFCDATAREKMWADAPADAFLILYGGHKFKFSRGQQNPPQAAHHFQRLRFSYGTYGFGLPRRSLFALRDHYARDLKEAGGEDLLARNITPTSKSTARTAPTAGAESANSPPEKEQQVLAPDVALYSHAKASTTSPWIYASKPLLVWHQAGFSNTHNHSRGQIKDVAARSDAWRRKAPGSD